MDMWQIGLHGIWAMPLHDHDCQEFEGMLRFE